MCKSIGSSQTQLHPFLVAMKEGWERLIVTKKIKQDWLAARCGVDKSQISRWKSPDEHDFPPFPKLALFIEAMQEWPEVARHEPIEDFARYFGCQVSDADYTAHGPLDKLAGLLALNSGKALQVLLEVTSPSSEGGREITENERELVGPLLHYLRHIVEDLDGQVNGGAR